MGEGGKGHLEEEAADQIGIQVPVTWLDLSRSNTRAHAFEVGCWTRTLMSVLFDGFFECIDQFRRTSWLLPVLVLRRGWSSLSEGRDEGRRLADAWTARGVDRRRAGGEVWQQGALVKGFEAGGLLLRKRLGAPLAVDDTACLLQEEEKKTLSKT